MDKNTITEQLKTNICEVVFTKVDGTVRIMPCTLKEDLLPASENKESKKKSNDNIISAWATDVNAWRSFRVDSVTDIKILEDIVE
jgi:hypothetical protein